MSPAAAEEARPENNVGFAGENGRQEQKVLGRIVFEVGILDDHDVRSGVGNAGTQGGTFALIDFVMEQPDAGIGGRERLQRVPSIVARTVVDYDEFGNRALGQNFLNDCAHGRCLIEYGHYDSKARIDLVVGIHRGHRSRFASVQTNDFSVDETSWETSCREMIVVEMIICDAWV